MLGRRLATICAMIVAVLTVTGCVTAYTSTNVPFASCEDFEKQRATKLQEQLGSNPLPSVQLRSPDLSAPYKNPSLNSDDRLKPIILRYSESGNLVNRCDYSKALKVIEQIEEEKVVLIFAHGWRNDSGPRANVAYNFNDAQYPDETLGSDLEEFSKLATRVSRATGKPVVPIFLSWKGGSGVPGFDYFTLWDRKGGADRIVRGGEINRLLGAIENIDDAQQGSAATSKNQIVFIGHSFGSRILYGSVVKDLIVRTQLAYPVGPGAASCDENAASFAKVKAPADLILLFNPAFEASAYRALDEFSYSCPVFEEDQRPLMMIFQSRSDKAVRLAFPIGQFIGFQFGSLRTTGVGFWKDYWTHNMRRHRDPADDSGHLSGSAAACDGEVFRGPDLRYPASVAVGDKTHRYDVCHYNRERLIGADRMPERRIRTSPFAVIAVEEDVLDGHVWFNRTEDQLQLIGNDDRGEAFNTWLVELIAERNAEYFSQ